MKKEEFGKKCFKGLPKDELFPNATDAQEGLEILVKHFLGYTPIVNYPCRAGQWNSEAIYEVLEKYPEWAIRKIPKSKS